MYEASGRLGGKILSNRIGPAVAEGGPDSIVARNSIVSELVRDLGLEDEVVRPRSSKSYLWSRGRLRPIPQGLFGGYPAGGILPLLRSGILSPAGMVRVAAEVLLPRSRIAEGGDVSVGQLVRSRFGDEYRKRIADPLMGGLMSCSSDYLSAAALAPSLLEKVRSSRSVLLSSRKVTGPRQSVPFFSFRNGTGELVKRLAEACSGIDIHTGETVSSVEPGSGGWVVRSGRGEEYFDAVIAAVPAFAASRMLSSMEELSSRLSTIHYTSVANVVFSYRDGDFSPGLEGSGFLVPECEGLMMTGCSWLSSKWSNAEYPGHSIVRCFAGTPDSTGWSLLDDEALASWLHGELNAIVGTGGKPESSLVTRWDRALPQYRPGHRELVAGIRKLTPPGLYLTGAAYGGVGLSSCIADASMAADSAASRLSSL